MALCLVTLHSAFTPQVVVKQGFWHFSLIHARWSGHSGSVVHSGFLAGRDKVSCCRNICMKFPCSFYANSKIGTDPQNITMYCMIDIYIIDKITDLFLSQYLLHILIREKDKFCNHFLKLRILPHSQNLPMKI